jgi:hypothetical protein
MASFSSEPDRPTGGTVYGAPSGPRLAKDRPMMAALAVGAVGVLLGVLFATGAFSGDGGPGPALVPAAGSPIGAASATPGGEGGRGGTPAASAAPTPAAPTPAAPAPRLFRSLASSLCLDVVAEGDPEGAESQQTACTGAANQLWLANSAGSDWVTLVNSASGKCLDVDGSSTDDEAKVRQRACTGAPNQQWRVGAAGNNAVTVVNVNSGKCLDVPGLSTDPGARLQQYSCNGGANQQWAGA